jgi:hypothetical protein
MPVNRPATVFLCQEQQRKQNALSYSFISVHFWLRWSRNSSALASSNIRSPLSTVWDCANANRDILPQGEMSKRTELNIRTPRIIPRRPQEHTALLQAGINRCSEPKLLCENRAAFKDLFLQLQLEVKSACLCKPPPPVAKQC